MIVENVSTLKIQKMSKEQYDREDAAGNLDGHSIYLTPDEQLTLEDIGAMSAVNPTGSGYLSIGRKSGTTVGENSVAIGVDVVASGVRSFASGDSTTASGSRSHAEGVSSVSEGVASHAEGGSTKAIGYGSHSEGFHTGAYGNYSHSEGKYTSAINEGAHSEGVNTTASRRASHAEGISSYVARDIIYNNSDGLDLYDPSLSEALTKDEILSYWNINNFSLAIGQYGSHVEGMDCLALDGACHAEGSRTKALGYVAHSEGFYSEAHGSYSHVEGCKTSTAPNGQYSHAEGYSDAIARDVLNQTFGEENVFDNLEKVDIETGWNNGKFSLAYGFASHIEGVDTLAAGKGSHAEGYYTNAYGDYSHTSGYFTRAQDNQYAIGHYNGVVTAGENSGTSGSALIIGNGTSTTSRANAFRVNYDGTVYAKSSSISTGADYAEYFEWQDSNANSEDRRGYFVTLDGDKIKIAEPNDYILGIVSGQPSVIGNGDEDWRGRYIMDEFGAFITEDFEYEEEIHEEVIDEKTGEATTIIKTVAKTGKRYKQNPDYDPTLKYIQRADRPEWDAVGMMGVLSVRDDGTCQVNGFCKVSEGGIATASESGYRVIKRVSDNIIKVVLK